MALSWTGRDLPVRRKPVLYICRTGGNPREGSCHELSARTLRRFPRLARPAAGLAVPATAAGVAGPAAGMARAVRAGQPPRLGDSLHGAVLPPIWDCVAGLLQQGL